MSRANIEKWFRLADDVDRREGAQAYIRYRIVMESFVERFGYPLETTVAAFVALSPNTDYLSNLRSLVSVLHGLRNGIPHDEITVSTYNHNKRRAISYLLGEAPFVAPARGRKILSFYDNILYPLTSNRVTVDGHMIAIWRDENLTMKEATVRPREYDAVEAEVRRLAFYHQMVPCEMQAVLWFTRKRVQGIKFKQAGLFDDQTDQWGTLSLAHELQPYGKADGADPEAGRSAGGLPLDAGPDYPLLI